MKSKEWYVDTYGDDWWEIVYEQDEKEEVYTKKMQKLMGKAFSKSNNRAAWMSDGINQ